MIAVDLLQRANLLVVEAQHLGSVIGLVAYMGPVTATELGVGLVLHQPGLYNIKQWLGCVALLQPLHARANRGTLLLGIGAVVAPT